MKTPRRKQMNNDRIIDLMIDEIIGVEEEFLRRKFSIKEIKANKNAAKLILDKLEEQLVNED